MDKNILVELVSAGKTTREIAAVIGKSQTAARYWLRKFSLKVVRHRQATPRCRTCGETELSRMRKRGVLGRSKSKCTRCHVNETIERFHRLKRRDVEYKGGKCTRCGYDTCMDAMEFHHVDPEVKDPRWVKSRHWGWVRRKKLLDECILVCANCHREKHANLW